MFDQGVWLKGFIACFLPLGFFSDKSGYQHGRLQRWLTETIASEWGEPIEAIAATDRQADIFALCCDRTRVLTVSADGVYPGENAYLEVVEGCARIAPDLFRPRAIREQWRDDNAHVEFTVADKVYRFVSNGSKYLDAAIVHTVNQAIAHSGCRYVVSDELGMPNVFMALKREDIARLKRDRAWSLWNDV